jgi:hypothetical protein
VNNRNLEADRALDDGGSVWGSQTRDDDTITVDGGLSLRDYFAGQALTGVIANALAFQTRDADHIAKMAYEAADAMLAARRQSQEG